MRCHRKSNTRRHTFSSRNAEALHVIKEKKTKKNEKKNDCKLIENVFCWVFTGSKPHTVKNHGQCQLASCQLCDRQRRCEYWKQTQNKAQTENKASVKLKSKNSERNKKKKRTKFEMNLIPVGDGRNGSGAGPHEHGGGMLYCTTCITGYPCIFEMIFFNPMRFVKACKRFWTINFRRRRWRRG